MLQYGILLMPEKQGGSTPLPEPYELIGGIASDIGLDTQKKPALFEQPPTEQWFTEEAPTFDGRYIAGECLEQIYNLALRHTPPGAPIRLSKGDVQWFHQEFRQAAWIAWQNTVPSDPFPDFTLTHLLGATKRQIAHYSELKRFHENEVFDPAIRTYDAIAHVLERAIEESDPDPAPSP